MVGTKPSTTNAGRKHNASGPAMRTPAFSATACAASCAWLRYVAAVSSIACARRVPDSLARRPAVARGTSAGVAARLSQAECAPTDNLAEHCRSGSASSGFAPSAAAAMAWANGIPELKQAPMMSRAAAESRSTAGLRRSPPMTVRTRSRVCTAICDTRLVTCLHTPPRVRASDSATNSGKRLRTGLNVGKQR